MKLRFTTRNLLAFFALGVIMAEAHEIAHFLVGKVACGCWPVYRDFNSWRICECALSYTATAAGPLFSFAVAWTGMFMLYSNKEKFQSLGFALIWGSVPQARVATVLEGGGDEMVVLKHLTSGTGMSDDFSLLATIIVFTLALPPIIAVYIKVKNKLGWLINTGFLIGSMAIWGAYVFGLMNYVLNQGVLNTVWIMGTPLLITLHTIVFLIIVIRFRKEFLTYAVSKSN